MNQKKTRTAITPTRAEDYPEWYQQVDQGGRPGGELATCAAAW